MNKPYPELTATVASGLGDVWWVLQRLLPLADAVHLRVIEDKGLPRPVGRRALPLLREIPGVGDVSYTPFDPADAAAAAWLSQRRGLAPLLPKMAAGDFPAWCANPWLEAGTPLEEVDPQLPTLWGDFGVGREPLPGLEPGRYLVLYASGDTVRHARLGEKIWHADAWARFAERVCHLHDARTTLTVVPVGATFDLPVLSYVADTLRRQGVKAATPLCDLSLPELLWLFGSARGALMYQSGLGAVCDAAAGRQMFVYFPRLRQMADTWVSPAGRADRRFNWGYFDQTPDELALLTRFPAPDPNRKGGVS